MLAVLLCGLFGCSKVTTDDIFYRVFKGALRSSCDKLDMLGYILYSIVTYYPSRTTDHYIDVPSGNAAELHNILDTSKPTQFYIHGWQEKCDNISAMTVASALLSRGASNVCCLDWSKSARDNYISAGNSTYEIAKIFSKDISGMCELGFHPGGMNLLGFSLGAHIAGFTGRNLQIAGYPNLGQITALDAALPLMYPPMCLGCGHLEPTDADKVWAIHTCGGTYGVLEPTAQVDIYPNYGTPIQIGCPLVPERFDVTQIMPTHRCNHDRSWKLYADAIMNPNSQICVRCDSSSSFSANYCANNTRISIGVDMPENTSGSYYYMTNGQSPYGRGEPGTNPSSS